jgi:flagellar basal body-associated protein FliL
MSNQQAKHLLKALRKQRDRINQWSHWDCDLPTLGKMNAELTQEMEKLAQQIGRAELEFEKQVNAGDPITLELVRQEITLLGRKWDTLYRRQQQIDLITQQKELDLRLGRLGKRVGLADLGAWLRRARVLALAISVIAVGLALLNPTNAGLVANMDTFGGWASLLLSAEFALRLLLVKGRWLYARRRAFDILLSLPLVQLFGGQPELANLARWFTLLRLGRLLRILLGERKDRVQGVQFLRSPQFVLLRRAIFIALGLVVIGAFIMRSTDPAQFANFDENLWWGLKIILTGNVDTNPATSVGRFISIGIIIIGVAITSVLIASVTAIFVGLAEESSNEASEQDEINEKLSLIQGQLNLLTDARQNAIRATSAINHALVNLAGESADKLDRIIAQLVTQFGCLTAALYQLDDNTRQAVRIYTHGLESLMPPPSVSYPERISGADRLLERTLYAARVTGEVRRPDLDSEPRPLADATALGLPLFVARHVGGQRQVFGIGALYIVIPMAWQADDLMKLLLCDVADALSLALYADSLRRDHDQLLGNIHDIQDIMGEITADVEYQKVLFAIAKGARRALDMDMSKVMLLDEPRRALRAAAWDGMSDEAGKRLYSQLGMGLSGLCAQTNRPVRSANLLTDGRVQAETSQALRDQMRAELCVPIRARGQVLGVLSVMSKQSHAFSPEEEAMLTVLAGQAGGAILNARSYQQLQQSTTGSNVDDH